VKKSTNFEKERQRALIFLKNNFWRPTGGKVIAVFDVVLRILFRQLEYRFIVWKQDNKILPLHGDFVTGCVILFNGQSALFRII
jgi:hypothetical protein